MLQHAYKFIYNFIYNKMFEQRAKMSIDQCWTSHLVNTVYYMHLFLELNNIHSPVM